MGLKGKSGKSVTEEEFESALFYLKKGKPVLFPTETVYGLGVSVLHAQSPQCLFELKQRPQIKPVAWLVGEYEDLGRYGLEVPEYALAFAKRFWPGPLTMIVNASSKVPSSFASGEGSIGLRMPDSEVALSLVRRVGCPLATTSANMSGKVCASDSNELDKELLRRVREQGYVITGEVCGSGVASTVVDCRREKPKILRQGQIDVMTFWNNLYNDK